MRTITILVALAFTMSIASASQAQIKLDLTGRSNDGPIVNNASNLKPTYNIDIQQQVITSECYPTVELVSAVNEPDCEDKNSLITDGVTEIIGGWMLSDQEAQTNTMEP